MKSFQTSFVFAVSLLFLSSCAQGQENLAASAFSQKIKADKSAVVMDVRTPDEFTGGHLANAINVDVKSTDFSQRCDKLDRKKTYYVYCLAGVRSNRAAQVMRAKGFRVVTLDGGITAWKDAGLPVVK